MASGQYFLSKEQKRAKEQKEREQKHEEAAKRREERRQQAFVPPEESRASQSTSFSSGKIDLNAIKEKVKKAQKNKSIFRKKN